MCGKDEKILKMILPAGAQLVKILDNVSKTKKADWSQQKIYNEGAKANVQDKITSKSSKDLNTGASVKALSYGTVDAKINYQNTRESESY